jgi:hypothetical protein
MPPARVIAGPPGAAARRPSDSRSGRIAGALNVAVLPRATPLDVGGLGTDSRDPFLHGLGGETLLVLTTARDLALRRTMLPERRTGATLGDMQLRSHLLNAGSATRGA